MKSCNVAILGASGAVGQKMLEILIERKFPYAQLRLLTSKTSAGKTVDVKGKTFTYEEAKEGSFRDMDIVFGAVDEQISKMYAPYIKDANALYIDNSSAFRLDQDVPLIIPEINKEDIMKCKGIVANPNCSTILALMAVYPIHKKVPIKKMIISSYQAVSGAGKEGINELLMQIESPQEVRPKVFTKPIAFNVIPQIGSLNEIGYSSEEMKLQNEARKILHHPNLKVSCTCVRVPVVRCHSESITLELSETVDIDQIRECYIDQEGVVFDELPTPLDYSDQDLVAIGRVRNDLTNDKGIVLWCCMDQLRKGAATNAVQIAELFLE